jgi:hypothetical protein
VTEATEVVTRNEASRGDPGGVSQVHRPAEGIQRHYLAKAPVAVHQDRGWADGPASRDGCRLEQTLLDVPNVARQVYDTVTAHPDAFARARY